MGEGERDYSFDAFRQRVEGKIEELCHGAGYPVVFRLKGESPIAVTVFLSGIIRGPFQSCYIGWSCEGSLEGKGYAREAVGEVLDRAFTTLSLHRVEANIVPENARSIALAKACGFRYEGFSPSYLCIRGHWREHQHWVLLNEAYDRPDPAPGA